MALAAVRLKGRVEEDGQLIVTEKLSEIPPGEVELLVLYTKPHTEAKRHLKLTAVDLGTFRGQRLSREEVYDDAR